MQVSQERLLQYIHFNRHHNTMLINDAVKKIVELEKEMAKLRQDNQASTVSPVEVEGRKNPIFPIVWGEEEDFEEEEDEE